MPHMSNLPWMTMYCGIFTCVILLCAAHSPSLSLNMAMKQHKANSKKSNLWLW